jgi:hypothetical protein
VNSSDNNDLSKESVTGDYDLSVTENNEGMTRVQFSLSLNPWECPESTYAAMQKLTAVALWWLDTDPDGVYQAGS